MVVPIIDLHCDLLAYLGVDPVRRSPLDRGSRCSIAQLEKGKVHLQTLALFSETKRGSYRKMIEQQREYHKLLEQFHDRVIPITAAVKDQNKIQVILSIENGACFLDEEEPFEVLHRRFESFNDPLLYISLTWNEENRFGGGSFVDVGLKREGEIFLELMADKGVAIDLSHASDRLAEDILNYLHKKGLSITPLASHSNFRALLDCPRNLSDAIAKEVVRMGGVIGINMIKKFTGKEKDDILKHVEYGLDLVGEAGIVLGADFFGGIEGSSLKNEEFYYQGLDNSSCYPKLIEVLEKKLSVAQIKNIAYLNAERLLSRQGFSLN
jgi:membrane dipeptidase